MKRNTHIYIYTRLGVGGRRIARGRPIFESQSTVRPPPFVNRNTLINLPYITRVAGDDDDDASN